MKKGLYNILCGTVGQFIVLALGILVPRFVLVSYGDEANGLINAVGQVFTYLALIEAGVGQAALQALYGPTVRDDHREINGILSATQLLFRRLTAIYMVAVAGIAFLYPLFVTVKDTAAISVFGSTYWAIALIILVQGISNAITFYFVATLRQALIADGRNYIIVNITTLIRVATSVLRIVLINWRINLVLLQLVYVALSGIEALLYWRVLKRRYPWLSSREQPNHAALAQKNAFVVHETCNVVFNSTDVLLLSVFCSLEVASIYAIYNLVFAALNQLISQIHGGCYYILGQTYSGCREQYETVHDAYDTYYFTLVFSLISTAYVMILPFVKLYTAGATQINYVDPVLPLLFCAIQLLSCCRITCSNLIKLAGHAKATVWRAVLEAVINLTVSLVLVNFVGIYGVLLGTVAALLYRTNDMILYANGRILHRPAWKSYKTVITNFAVFGGIVFLCSGNILSLKTENFYEFFITAAIVCAVISCLYFAVNSFVNRDSFRWLCSKLGKAAKK